MCPALTQGLRRIRQGRLSVWTPQRGSEPNHAARGDRPELYGKRVTRFGLVACYQPEPGDSFAVEFGPIPTGRVIGLTAALWGPDAKATLTNTAKALSQRWTHRVRLEFDAEGLKRSTALLTTADVNRADW